MENNTTQPAGQGAGAQSVSLMQLIKQSKAAKIIIAVVILAIIVGIWFAVRGRFIAATVNGTSISRSAVMKELEMQGGKSVVDSLITEQLVKDEVKKKGILVSQEEINAEIKKIEDSLSAQGQTLEIALASQGMPMAKFRDNISTQIAVKKLLADKTSVTDAEVAKYITDSKMTIPKGKEVEAKAQVKEQLENQKLNDAAGAWVASLRSSATIKYYVEYK